jgi:DNA-binding MarR family transcriptional regulator
VSATPAAERASPATPAAAELRRLLRELTRLGQHRDRARLSAAGITVSGGHALELLAERGALSLTALSAALFVDRSTACRIVGLLEDRGLLLRAPDPDDGRAIRVGLTPAGRALEARLRDQALRDAAEWLEALDSGMRGEALALLRALVRAQHP